MMAGLCELVSRDPHTDERTKLDTTFRHLRELTRTMEAEIPEAVLSCARARRQMLRGHPHREADGPLTLIGSDDRFLRKLCKVEALYAGAKTAADKYNPR
jgi:hypothetical protein